MMLLTLYPKSTPPHNITIYKGSNQVAMSRAFALYFMHSPVSKDLMTWFADTLAPDEYVWPTINHNAHLLAPGAYKGKSRHSLPDPYRSVLVMSTVELPLCDHLRIKKDHLQIKTTSQQRQNSIFIIEHVEWF